MALMAAVQPINLLNFTGGLNLRADAFQLGDDESPDMLNVDLDPRGGFACRGGWSRLNTAPIAGTWNPRTLFVHELASGNDNLWLYSTTLKRSLDRGATWIDTTLVGNAAPHGVDFGHWGDFAYCARGPGHDARRVDAAATVVALPHAQAATFSAYTAPVQAFPRASHVASHQGYMFAADTYEDGARYQYRIRWSHPNNPEAWASADQIEIKEGGGPITAIIPNKNHILVFQQAAVWALYGFNSDNWNLVNVSRELGALHRQVVAQSERGVFFYSHPQGVYVISDEAFPEEISEGLRPALESSAFNRSATDEMWLGWVGQKLWFSLPYWESGVATTARTTFTWDPTMSNGAWAMHRAADGYGVGPFAQGGRGGGGDLDLAAHRNVACVVNLEATTSAYDNLDGTQVPITAHYTTRWVDGGYPTLKKKWRRPDVIAKERSQEYDLTLDCYYDLDEVNVRRSQNVDVESGGTGALWNNFTFNDGTMYGAAAKGSRIERASNLGSARSVQLRISGTPGRRWGVDAIVFKFIPRRMR